MTEKSSHSADRPAQIEDQVTLTKSAFVEAVTSELLETFYGEDCEGLVRLRADSIASHAYKRALLASVQQN